MLTPRTAETLKRESKLATNEKHVIMVNHGKKTTLGTKFIAESLTEEVKKHFGKQIENVSPQWHLEVPSSWASIKNPSKFPDVGVTEVIGTLDGKTQESLGIVTWQVEQNRNGYGVLNGSLQFNFNAKVEKMLRVDNTDILSKMDPVGESMEFLGLRRGMRRAR